MTEFSRFVAALRIWAIVRAPPLPLPPSPSPPPRFQKCCSPINPSPPDFLQATGLPCAPHVLPLPWIHMYIGAYLGQLHSKTGITSVWTWVDIFHTDTCDMGLQGWENVKMVCENRLWVGRIFSCVNQKCP